MPCDLVLPFQVLHFHALRFGPPFSGPAFSGPTFSAPPIVAQLPGHSRGRVLQLGHTFLQPGHVPRLAPSWRRHCIETVSRTISEIFSVKEWSDVETGAGVVRSH